MEGIGAVWAVLMIIMAIVTSVKNSKQRQQAQQNRNASGSPLPGQQQAQRAPARPASQAAPAPRPAAQASPPQMAAHTAKPLETHMHAPIHLMGQEGVGTEGEDCCHDYMLTSDPERIGGDLEILPDTNEEERARALLQGVIFSEILGRRPVKRYGGHQA